MSTPENSLAYPTLIYMNINCHSVGRPLAPYAIREPIFYMWDDYLAEWSKTAPEGINVVFHTADYYWAFIESEKAFFKNAVFGMITSIIMATGILLFSTDNVVITFYSIISIGFICACVSAVMVMSGW